MKAVAADVVIVGSGVAGALVAERLARAGIGVAVLEAGSRIDRAQALARYFQAPVKTPGSPYLNAPEADFPLSADDGHWYWQSGPDRFKRDEPESNLNPGLIREVAKAILGVRKAGVQVLVATHSLFLCDRNAPPRDAPWTVQ